MKVVADKNIALVREAFSQFGPIHTVSGREINREMLKDASILLVRSVTSVNKELLHGTAIKFVASATIGFDHVDTQYLSENNIGFAYAPGSSTESVAEYTITAILTIVHKLNLSPDNLTLGIVGAGNIGSRVYHYAELLGIRCLLNDPPKKRLTSSKSFLPLEDVLRDSDIITLHVPLNTSGKDNTYHLVNQAFISSMKQNASLINTSRGKVIDELSIRAKRDRIGCLVLDVWESEPAINPEIFNIADIGTPHIAGYSYEGKIKGTEMIYGAACDFFSMEKIWKIKADNESGLSTKIDISNSGSPLYDAVTSAYPIRQDHNKLKGISGKNAIERKSYFDELRNSYPRRREFPQFTIKCGEHQSSEKLILSQLGFKIQ